MIEMKYKQLQREQNYNPLTEESFKNDDAVTEMLERLQNIKKGERITYFQGKVGIVNRVYINESDNIAAAIWNYLKTKKRKKIRGSETVDYFYDLVFLSEKIKRDDKTLDYVFDYIVVGKWNTNQKYSI